MGCVRRTGFGHVALFVLAALASACGSVSPDVPANGGGGASGKQGAAGMSGAAGAAGSTAGAAGGATGAAGSTAGAAGGSAGGAGAGAAGGGPAGAAGGPAGAAGGSAGAAGGSAGAAGGSGGAAGGVAGAAGGTGGAAGAPSLPPVTPSTKWNDPTGQKDSFGNALKMTFDLTGLPANVVFKCRSGKLTGPGLSYVSSPTFAACDPNGYTFGPTADGTHKTEVFYTAGTYTSPTYTYEYYVHKSLDGVATCPAKDDTYFTAAKNFSASSAANAALFPLTASFPAPGTPAKRTDAIFIRNPWFSVPFTNVAPSTGMKDNPGVGLWPTTAGQTVTVDALSLRHKLVLNGPRTMLLYRRQYEHPTATAGNKCKNLISFGSDMGTAVGPTSATRGKRLIDCQALVISATNGAGICFDANGLLQALDGRLAATPSGQPGTVSVAANSATVTGTGTGFGSAIVGAFITFSGAGDLRMHQIISVQSMTGLTIADPPPFTVTNATFKLVGGPLTTTQVTPSGYAKLVGRREAATRRAFSAAGGVAGNKCTLADLTTCPNYPNVYALPP
jgi:hypothetical protein